MSTREALDLAKQEGLDLVEIAATTDPPVCRIVDYGKFKYQQAKQQKNNNSKTARQKEIKLGVAIDVNDYNVKMARAERFLDAGHKVRFVIRLKGRQNAHPELALEKLNQVIADMKTMAAVDQAPRQAGATSSMLLTPLPKQQRVLKFGNIEVTEEDDDADDDE
jgi:translation initiation factor IF-3